MTRKQEEDGTISYEGFCIDLLEQLAKMLRFTYKIYPSPDGQYGGIVGNEDKRPTHSQYYRSEF